jgi:hypothetical protein
MPGPKAESPSVSDEIGGLPGRRICLLVVGMHRSGTSAMTGLLSRLGVTLPASLMAANEYNPLGYGESQAFMRFHDRILASAGSNWHDFGPFKNDWFNSATSQAFARELRDLIEMEFGASRLMVIKDPRISRFLPFWLEQLNKLHIGARIVICLRNPIEVAASLSQRDGFSFGASLLLWLRHMLDAEVTTRAWPRSIVQYENLLADWRGVADCIAADLALDWPTQPVMTRHDIDNFLSPILRHHNASLEQLIAREDVIECAKILYQVFRQIAYASSGQAFKGLDVIRSEFDSACVALGPLSAGHPLDDATARLKELEARAAEFFRNEDGQRFHSESRPICHPGNDLKGSGVSA